MIRPVDAFGLNRSLGTSPVVPLSSEEFAVCVENKVAICSTGKMQKLRFLPQKPKSVNAIAFHRGKKLLAVCGGECAVVYKRERVVAAFEDGGNKVAFSADGSILVCVGRDFAVGYDLSQKSVLWRSNDLGDSVTTLVPHPTDRIEVSTSGPAGHLRLWRLVRKGQLKQRPTPPQIDNLQDLDFTCHNWFQKDLIIVAGTRQGGTIVVFAISHSNGNPAECCRRFDGVNDDEIRAIVPLEDEGFASICRRGTVCIFNQRRSLSTRNKAETVDIQVSRRVRLDGCKHLCWVATFPNSTTSFLVCCSDHLGIFDLEFFLRHSPSDDSIAAVDVAKMGVSYFHDSPVTTIAVAQSKPLFASCSSTGNCVCVWNWKTKTLAARAFGLSRKQLVCIDLHPGGHQLAAGLEDEICLYHVVYNNLVEAQTLKVKGIVTLKNDATPLVATNPLRLVKYSRSGSLFAAVAGRLVEIFATLAPGENGRAGLIQCLRGHAGNVVAVAWAPDDRTVWTASEDGAIYQWSVGDLAHMGRIISRCQEHVQIDVNWNQLACFENGGLVAAGHVRCCPDQQSAALMSMMIQSHQHYVKKATLVAWTSASIENGDIHVQMPDDIVVTSVATLDENPEIDETLLVGTSRGSVLLYLRSDSSFSTPAKEITLCRGPVMAMAFSCDGNRLMATGVDGTLLVCTVLGEKRAGKRFAPREVDAEEHEDSDEVVLIERGVLRSQEDIIATLTHQLEQAKLEASKKVDEATPKYQLEFDDLRRKLQSETESRDAEKEACKNILEKERAEHEAQLQEVKNRFSSSVAELETLYDRKLATEAARYMELQDERDRIALQAKEYLERQQEIVNESIERVHRENSSRLEASESEKKVLKDYVEHAKRQFHSLAEEQDRQHDIELAQVAASRAVDIAEADKIRQKQMLDNAKLKQDNLKLSEEAQKKRVELVESQQALIAQQEANVVQAEKIERQLQLLAVERSRAGKYEQIASEQGQKLKELERMRNVLTREKDHINVSLNEKVNTLKEKSMRLKHVDAVVEEAGRQNKALDQSLEHKSAELRRVLAMLKDCRARTYSKDNKLARIREHVERLLLAIKDPEIRPKEQVVAKIESIRDELSRILTSSHKDVAITAVPDQFSNRSHRAQLKPMKVLRPKQQSYEDAQHERDRQIIDNLRDDNFELMEELNELRFEKLSLRRKLKDGEFRAR